MPKTLILGTLLAVSVAHDIKGRIAARKFAKLSQETFEAYESVQADHLAMIRHLAHMIDDNGVEVSEFDHLALQYYM